MNKRILQLALPSIVSNITVPLLGLVDTAIVGHMGVARYIGAIAVGSMIFNVTYWLFGFLRMGTGGLTAQAFGRNDMSEASMTGIRSLLISTLIGLTIILLQVPLFSFALWVISPAENVLDLVWTYCKICVWGAPASLGLFALNGWFVGMQNTRIPMFISITQNLVNIAISLFLVYFVGLRIEGVALGTLIAQWSGFMFGLLFFIRKSSYFSFKFLLNGIRGSEFFPSTKVSTSEAEGKGSLPMVGKSDVDNIGVCESGGRGSFFSVNRDIFFRTLFLVAVNLYFVAAGAKGGTVILAVNTLLMQLFTLYSFVMDGFAYAAEALCGRYYGAKDYPSLHCAIRGVFRWSLVLTTIFTLVYVLGGQDFLYLLTDEPQVVIASREYMPWAWAIPFAGILAFVLDGIFIGMTMTRGMLLGTSIASITFFIVFFSLYPTLANHALWLAFILYLLMRGIVQSIVWEIHRP